jgi:hypothetical protein
VFLIRNPHWRLEQPGKQSLNESMKYLLAIAAKLCFLLINVNANVFNISKETICAFEHVKSCFEQTQVLFMNANEQFIFMLFCLEYYKLHIRIVTTKCLHSV